MSARRVARGRVSPVVPVVLLALALPVGLTAQSRIRAEVDTTRATVGDRITLTVTVDHPAGSRVTWPDSLDLKPFDVLEAHTSPDERRGDTLSTTARITVAAFQLGDLEIPSLKVTVHGPDDAVDTLATDAFGIRVVSVGADKGGDIRDIRGPMSIPLSVLRIALWGLAVVAVALAGWWINRRRLGRRRTPVPVAAPAAPARPPHEVALEALARLEASPLLERGQVKEYHVEASDILRTYVRGRFGVDAPEMTTDEALEGLRRAGVERRLRDELRRFLDPCDLVKFAKVRPTPEASRATLSLGRLVVESTVPPPVATEAPPPGPRAEGDGREAPAPDPPAPDQAGVA
jgi:BatD DUF11 like domain